MECGQMDLVDMQSMQDGSFSGFCYQQHLTKFHLLPALTCKRAVEVAREMLMIFLESGAPKVLQSDNGREFTALVINELASLWPELVLVNGRTRHPQSQGSIERAHGHMKNKLTAWMRDNNCPNWTLGILFVQWQMNTCVSEATGKEPYTLMFGKKPSLGLTTALPRDVLEKITPGISEEDLTDLIVQTGSADHTDAAPGANLAVAAPDANSTDLAVAAPDANSTNLAVAAPGANSTNVAVAAPDANLAVAAPDANLAVAAPGANSTDVAVAAPGANLAVAAPGANLAVAAPDANLAVAAPDANLAVAAPGANSTDQEDLGTSSDRFVSQRLKAVQNLRKLADCMTSRSIAKMKPLDIGDNVLIPVPGFDRGRGDPAHLLGVVVDKTLGRFNAGTKVGVLSGKFSRNQVEMTNYTGITQDMVPDIAIAIRSAVPALSVGHGQGYRRCLCTSTCLTKRCSCIKAALRCGSACHPRHPCKNVSS